MIDKKPSRLSVDLRPDQKQELDRLIPWGLGKPLWHAIIDDVIELASEHGTTFIGLLVTGKCRSQDILPSVVKAHEEVHKLESDYGDD